MSVRGCTYIYDAGTPIEQAVTQQFVPLHRRSISDAKDIVRAFNLHADEVAVATLDARSRPPKVVLVGVAFTSGQSVTLAHRLGTKQVLWWLASPASLSAGAPYATATALDATNLTLLAAGTFAADVVLEVRP